ncbi:P-loop NTPase fold protein [Luteimonas mephitis]|uniref:P-loop NTPase fold protein n=1 Tax=Luteimonas mephitis TaxID=83615 RepID=UPI00146AE73D|nr:P-loop NTPase fold protein [Luteimonas mephitis]
MLSRFLQSQEQNTILIRGPWGVGKTYAVTAFVDSFNFDQSPSLVARSYVSLFGKQTISAVQREIFSAAQQVGPDDGIRTRLGLAAHKLIQLEKYVAQSKLQRTWRWLGSKLGQVQAPWVGELGAMMSQGNYGLVDGFLVTIDDLERRSASVSLRDTLGLADELASHRNCKVIVICNEDALDEHDQRVLAEYKEKVFDLEILFARSPKDIASIGLPNKCSHRDVSESILEKLGISNIRVAKRYAFLVDQVWPDLERADPRISQEVLGHIAILTWARYDSTAKIPQERLGYLASESSWMASAMRDREEEKAEWEINWEAAAEALEFSPEAYDAALVEYLRTGIWIPGAISLELKSKGENLQKLEAAESMRAAWRLYSDSFNPDHADFVAALIGAVDRHLIQISPRDVDSAFHALEDLGVDFSDLAQRYVAAAREQIEAAAREDWPFEDFKSNALRPLIQAARNVDKVLPTIDAALERISIDRSWSEEDILALDACTEDDLFEWMKSAPENLPTKIRRGLLFLGSQKSDARYPNIGEKAKKALERMAGTSELNRIRIENMFNIKLERE